jgi:hypothetical protein
VNLFVKSLLRKPYEALRPIIIAGKQFFYLKSVESKLNKEMVGKSYSHQVFSELPVSVFIPVAIKDLECISQTVRSIREFLLHPIVEIVICAVNEDAIKIECINLDVKFVDEKTVQPIDKSEIKYNCNGIDRSGWLYQQFLKLSSVEYCQASHVLVWDSDTELVKPTNFEFQGRFIIEYSEEIHQPYEDCSLKLIGKNSGYNVGFTCHKILLSKPMLLEMLNEIEERHQLPWHEAVISSLDNYQASSFSEYNLYSNYVVKNHPDTIRFRHWRNFADFKSRSQFRKALIKKLFFSVSYHSWLH